MRECTTNILTTCAQLSYIKEFNKYYEAYGVRLLTDVGFAFLKTFKDEKREMLDNPSEFVKLALDVCDRQKLSVLKSQAAKFIETIGDKIPGFFRLICELSCDALEYAVTKDPNMELYPTLGRHYTECRFFAYCSDEDLIDVCLLTLTMVSYALPKQDKIKERFVDICERITKPVMERHSVLLNCRLTVMLGYYIDILYKGDESVFFDVISMFVNSLTADDDTLALAYQSADTLNTIINDNDIIPRIAPFINELLAKVVECVIVVKIPDFFDFLGEIFKFYKTHIDKDTLILAVKGLVQRIELDSTSHKGGARNPFKDPAEDAATSTSSTNTATIAIAKCWSILSTILETKEYIDNYIVPLEEELKYLFGLLSDPSKIEFDDDIIKSMKIIITNSNGLSETMRILFPYIKNSFSKHKFIYSELFDLVKAYCKYKDFVFSSEDHVNQLFGFGVEALFNEDRTANGAVYLIQLFLMLKDDNNPILNLVIPGILENVLTRLNEKPMNRNLKRILYCVVLASMVSNYRATFEYLENTNKTSEVMTKVLQFSVKKMGNSLERKLFAMSLTNILTQEELYDSVRDLSPKIIQKIVDVLVKSSIEEAKKVKKSEKKKFNETEDKDFDSDFDSSESESSESEDESDKENEDRETPNPESLGIDEEDKEDWNRSESTDSNAHDDLLETEIDIQSAFSMFKTGFNSFDEFAYFK